MPNEHNHCAAHQQERSLDTMGFRALGTPRTSSPIFLPSCRWRGRTICTTTGDGGLIFVGNLLFGFNAFAGWLADRWTATGMMAIFYVGTGAAMIMCGMAESPLALGFWLAMTGLFASIYHPVGIAWLVRESVNTGTVLGVNGIFGSLGTAAAAVMAGWLVHLYGWRSAYILPGIVVILTGLVFTGLLIKGVIIESKTDRKPPPPPSTRGETMRFTILVVTLACGGLIYNATNPRCPRPSRWILAPMGKVLMVSYLIGLVYTCATILQIIGGRCADKFSARRYTSSGICCKCLSLWLSVCLTGRPSS